MKPNKFNTLKNAVDSASKLNKLDKIMEWGYSPTPYTDHIVAANAYGGGSKIAVIYTKKSGMSVEDEFGQISEYKNFPAGLEDITNTAIKSLGGLDANNELTIVDTGPKQFITGLGLYNPGKYYNVIERAKIFKKLKLPAYNFEKSGFDFSTPDAHALFFKILTLYPILLENDQFLEQTAYSPLKLVTKYSDKINMVEAISKYAETKLDDNSKLFLELAQEARHELIDTDVGNEISVALKAINTFGKKIN